MATDFTRTSLRLAAAMVVAGGLTACSTMQSLDPTGLLGGDSNSSADTGGLSNAGAQAAEDTTQPDVASVPERPTPPSTDAENAQVATSLQADAANVQYSAESLRGGTEVAAPPPPNAPEASAPGTNTSPVQVAEAAPPPAETPAAAEAPANEIPDVTANNITPGTQGAEAAAESPAQPEAAPPPSDAPLTEAPPQPAPAAPPPDKPDNTAIPEPEPVATDAAEAPADQTSGDQASADQAPAEPEAAPAPEEAAAATPPEQPEAAPAPEAAATTEPAAPAAPAEPAAPASPAPAAAAPAPAPTQLASAGPVPGAQAPVTRRAAPGFAPSSAPPLDPSVAQFVSAPVVARYKQTATLKPSVFPYDRAPSGAFGPATATIIFPDDTTILDDKGLQQVRAAAELYKSQGGHGYVRIVGYASEASGSLSPARLMHVNFDHSQARATAIARALMKAGVPADKVLVDAAPQTASVAKAEIFVQG